jgi:peptidoglycan/LPS O-acetylase OafA/YrhL
MLMALAALLVTNSHLERYYPRSWLAGDGLLGICLFFFLAGFGLVASEQNRPRRFLPWLWRRAVRLYPTLFLVVGVFGLGIGSEWRNWSPRDYPTHLIWPTLFTYVFYVVPFYFVFFPLMKLRRPWVFPAAAISLIIVYACGYYFDLQRIEPHSAMHLSGRPQVVLTTAYLQIMLLGGWLAFRRQPASRSVASQAALATLLGVVYLALKFAKVLGYAGPAYPLLHVFAFALCFALFDFLTAPSVVAYVRRHDALSRVATLIAALTLEIYLVHEYTAKYEWLWRTPFPWNLALFWGLTLPLAYIAGKVSGAIQSRLRA